MRSSRCRTDCTKNKQASLNKNMFKEINEIENKTLRRLFMADMIFAPIFFLIVLLLLINIWSSNLTGTYFSASNTGTSMEPYLHEQALILYKKVPFEELKVGDVISFRERKEIIRVIAYMRKWQFANLIWKINVVPYWEAKLSDINYDALAQHYGLATHLLDLTNDFRAALFFAACKYEASTDSYRPLTQSDIDESEDTKYGYIFHAPDWAIDYFNGGGHTNWSHKHLYKQESTEYIPIKKDRLYLQSGDMDGVALQIGYQPLQRCHHQSGYIYPMRNIASLQDDWHFEKLRFRQSVALSERVYEMMDHGKKVFPYEGVTELREQIDQIKHSTVFSEFELQSAYDYDGVDKRLFPSIEELRKSITGYNAYDGKICIQSDPVDYKIPQEILDKVNSHYDGKDLLEAVGGMLHVKYPDCEYRKQRCIEIYGREI